MLSSYLLPLLALVLGVPFAHVGYAEFLGWSAPPTLSAMAVILWIKKQGLLRPADGKILSWEMVLFQLARWPWVVCAIFDAVKCSMTKTTLEWKITPKGHADKPAIPVSMFVPYIIIVIASSIIGVAHANSPYIGGYLYLTIFNILTYVLLIATIAVCHHCENQTAN